MNAPDEIVINYEFSAEEHVQALFTLPIGRISRVVQITSASIAVGGSALMFVAASIAGKPTEGIVAALSFLPLGVLWWYLPVGLRALDIRRFRRETPDGTTQVRRFGSQGFSGSPDGPLIPWGLISEVRETPEAYLIADASSMVRVSMPKRALSPDEDRLFRSLAEKEFAHRPKQLKLQQRSTPSLPNRA